MNPWIYLFLAGCFEIGFTTFMKLSDGFSRWPSTVAFCACAILSFGLLNKSVTAIPLGTAYAVWTGLGAFGTAIVGIALFKDSADGWRIFFLATLIVSIMGLKFVSPANA
jgi:quaternary ammonium compound-resistance protein SugE